MRRPFSLTIPLFSPSNSFTGREATAPWGPPSASNVQQKVKSPGVEREREGVFHRRFFFSPPLHFRPAFCIFPSPPLDIEELRGLRVCAPELLSSRGGRGLLFQEGGAHSKGAVESAAREKTFLLFPDCGRILAHDIFLCSLFLFLTNAGLFSSLSLSVT